MAVVGLLKQEKSDILLLLQAFIRSFCCAIHCFFLNGPVLVCAYLPMKSPVVTYGQVLNGLWLNKE